MNVLFQQNNTTLPRTGGFRVVVQQREGSEWYNVPNCTYSNSIYQFSAVNSTNMNNLQTQINNASNNANILVAAGTYIGNLVITNKSINLFGNGEVIFKANKKEPIVKVLVTLNASRCVTFSNITFTEGYGRVNEDMQSSGGVLYVKSTYSGRTAGANFFSCVFKNNVLKNYKYSSMIFDETIGACFEISDNANVSVNQSVFYGNVSNTGVIASMKGISLEFAKCTIDQNESSKIVRTAGQIKYYNSAINNPTNNSGLSYLTYLYSAWYNVSGTQPTGTNCFLLSFPKFVNATEHNYNLSKGSKLIGTGYNYVFDSPEIPGYDQDLLTKDDETADIGAFDYDGDRYITYNFSNSSAGNWQSFPIIDDGDYTTINNTSYLNDVIAVFFKDYSSANSPLIDVSFRYPNSSFMLTGVYSNQNLLLWHHMKATLGYVSRFNSSTSLYYHGYITPYTTPVPIPISYQECWIGYFLPNTQTPQAAFGTMLNNLYYIQHKNWTMVRTKPIPSAPWLVTVHMGQYFTISYGEMLKVKRFDNSPLAFVWCNSNQNQTEYKAEDTSYYSFVKEPEYKAVFVELDSISDAKEVGLFVDDICVGAAVVESKTVMVPAYISDYPEDTEISVELWNGSKGNNKVKSFMLYQQKDNQWITSNRIKNTTEDFHYVSFNKKHNEIEEPIKKFALNNYPNPFNPTTTISFDLPSDDKIEIEIFNIKGQLVKTLIKETKNAGHYQIVWEGKDNQGKAVGSGVYFTKMKTSKQNLVKKMLLMK